MATYLKYLIILQIVVVNLYHFAQGQSEQANISLDKALNSPKISDQLKTKIIASSKANLQAIGNVIIEFVGGNVKAIKAFEESEVAHRATATRAERISGLVEKLEAHAATSQNDVIDFLKLSGAKYNQLWASNEIFIKNTDAHVISEIAGRFENVALIRPEGIFKRSNPITSREPAAVKDSLREEDATPQPILQVNGRCSDIKCLGEGTVAAIIDTGVRMTHVELRDNYRHEYGWFDPISGTEHPRDTDIHGTHVAGIILGKTKGVAPKAQWIACLVADTDYFYEGPMKGCGQWAVCPTKWDGSDRDCSKAPNVINNSWNIVPYGEQQYIQRNFFYGIQSAWNTAGIHSIFSAGNDGPSCSTINPIASYDNAFAIAAVDITSTASYWTSRGPVINMEFDSPVDPSSGYERSCSQKCSGGNGWSSQSDACFITKPDIAAPGVRINSSISDSDNSYELLSGTSMAAPLVSGVLSLMVCASNQAQGNAQMDVFTARRILTSTAATKVINLEEGNTPNARASNFAKISNLLCNIPHGNSCGGYPNNIYGWGEVDACSAVQKVNGKL